jgi:hypothetical protein
VKNFRWWPVFGLTAVAVALTGCGDGGSGNASVRVANATLTHPSLELIVNSVTSVTAVTTDTVSAYVTPSSGSVTLQVNDNGGTTALNTTVPTLTGSDHYTLVAYETGGAVAVQLVGEDLVLPAAGVTTLRIYNDAVSAGAIDIYLTSLPCTTANLTGLTPTYNFVASTAPQALAQAVGSGTYNICVTGSGSKTDLRLSYPVVFTTATVANVLLTPASGGLLLNGSLLVQQGDYSAVRNTNARVRLAGAVSASATVAVSSSDGTVIDDGSVAPSFGVYTLVPATSTLNITVNGSSVAAPATSLAVGADMTVLVWGEVGSPVASLLTDDNVPPTDPTTTKLRLINGITGSSGTLTLAANNSAIASGIAGGAASPYGTTVVNTNSNTASLQLISSTAGTFAAISQALLVDATYSVLAGGDLSTAGAIPQMLIR